MSIFPRKTKPGNAVTIHCNVTPPIELSIPDILLLKISITDPAGETKLITEQNIIFLPNNPYGQEKDETQTSNKAPLLIVLDLLKGQRTKEEMESILNRMHSGRHYFFTYQLPSDSLLGKYIVNIETFEDGIMRPSLTAQADYFFVEELQVLSVKKKGDEYRIIVENRSPELTVAEIIEFFSNAKAYETSKRQVEFPANSEREIITKSPKSFLVYNEERCCLPLSCSGPIIIRNQKISSTTGKMHADNLSMQHCSDVVSCFDLNTSKTAIWNAIQSEVITQDEVLLQFNNQDYYEMLHSGLIIEMS